MQNKLTLRLDSSLIDNAKDWAKKHDLSVSQLVAQFFSQLPKNLSPEDPELSEWTKRISGKREKNITDEEIKKDYYNHILNKHQ